MKLNEYRRKKPNRYKGKQPAIRKPRLGGIRGGGTRRTVPPPTTLRRTHNYRTEQKPTPKAEKSHWNGKVETWTEPQKPKQVKIIRYEVDTDKLLNELSRGNKETLNEIAERFEETKAEPSPEQGDAENLQKIDSSEKQENSTDPEPKGEDEPEATKENAENPEPDEAETRPEKISDQQEASHEIEAESQENPLDAPELIYMSPSFWEKLESEMSNELEQLEPQEELELPPEEEPVDEEGY